LQGEEREENRKKGEKRIGEGRTLPPSPRKRRKRVPYYGPYSRGKGGEGGRGKGEREGFSTRHLPGRGGRALSPLPGKKEGNEWEGAEKKRKKKSDMLYYLREKGGSTTLLFSIKKKKPKKRGEGTSLPLRKKR